MVKGCFRNPRTGVYMRRKAHGKGFEKCRGKK
jgi:hypothetical protein